MTTNAIMLLPLTEVLRSEIALSLVHILRLNTVGSLLVTWRSPRGQTAIERAFESPLQARHAMATLEAWTGLNEPPAPVEVPAWWRGDGPRVNN